MSIMNIFRRQNGGARVKESALEKRLREADEVLTEMNVGQDEAPEALMRKVFPRTIADPVDMARPDGRGGFATRRAAMDAATDDDSPMKVKARALMARDAISSDVWRYFTGESYIGWTACAMLAQNPIIHIVCATPAADAIAAGYDVKYADHNEPEDGDKDGTEDTDYLLALRTNAKTMGIDKVCEKLDYNKSVFGSGVAVPVIMGKDGKPLDMSNPFNADGLKGCRYKGFKVIEPYWLNPEFEDGATSDPTHPRFMLPTWYRLPTGRRIHHTWFVKVDNAEVPDLLKPAYYYGGMPLTQMIFRRVWCAEKTANEAPLLAQSKRLLVVDANVQQVIKNKTYVKKLMDVITKCRNNWGVFFKSPTAQVQQIDTTLSEFEECMFSQYQLVASIAQMPATKLLQTTPKGFNSTGEFEWKIYAQKLSTIQDTEYRPLLERHFEIVTACQGKPRKLCVVFRPVDEPSEKDRADIESTKSTTRCNYVQNGVLTPEEVREVLRNDEAGDFTGIAADAPEPDDAAEREEILGKVDGEGEE